MLFVTFFKGLPLARFSRAADDFFLPVSDVYCKPKLLTKRAEHSSGRVLSNGSGLGVLATGNFNVTRQSCEELSAVEFHAKSQR